MREFLFPAGLLLIMAATTLLSADSPTTQQGPPQEEFPLWPHGARWRMGTIP